MSSDDPDLETVADKNLVKEATLSGSIFLIAWLIVVFTTTAVPLTGIKKGLNLNELLQ